MHMKIKVTNCNNFGCQCAKCSKMPLLKNDITHNCFKCTLGAIYNQSAVKTFDFLNDENNSRVIKSIYEMALNWTITYYARIKECESPIEQLFALYFWDIVYRNQIDFPISLINQHTYKVEGKKIRVDFVIMAVINNRTYSIVVECDGHDFHEKTKIQAKNDNQRDRLLKSLGLGVIRFTGSEIWENPEHCVYEAIGVLKGTAELKAI